MALTATDSGRITTQPKPPSGSSMPSDLASLIARSMAGAGSGGGTAGGGVPLTISLDGRAIDPGRRRRRGSGYIVAPSGNGRSFSTIDEAVNSFYLLDDDYREDLQKRMWYYGLIDTPNDLPGAIREWGKAVTMAWNFKQAGKDVNPVELFGRMTNLKAGQLGGAPRTRTVTQRQINFTDPEVAKAWLREAFQSSMGRDPHDAEIRSMLRAIAEGNRNDPTVVQSTTDAEGNTTQRTLDPGFDPQAYIRNQMDDDPESAAYEAANTLYPALMEALASPV